VTEPIALKHLTESYLETRWHVDPVDGSGAGRAACDGRLGSFDEAGIRQYVAALRALAGAVEGVDVSSLDDEIDRTVLLYDIRLAEHRFRAERPHRRNPGLWTDHVLEGLYQLLVLRGRDPAALARAAAERLAEVPRFLDAARETLADCPLVFVQGAQDALRAGAGLIGDLDAAFGDAADPADVFRVRAADARAALERFGAHLAGLARETGPEEPWGVGREAFGFRLRHQHALSDSTEDLLRYAGRLMEEAEHELRNLARVLGFAEWPDALERLRTDAPPAGSVVASYEDVVRRARDHVHGSGLASVPDGALEVLETPAHARPWIPIAAYLPPGALSDDRTGRFFVTVPDAEEGGSRCRHEIPAAVAHEGYPGHHLHFLTALAQPRVVRRLLTSPISIEGWALYAEGLMDETGFHSEPAERFFHCLALLWRALRVPLDIGVHTGALTFAAATRLLMERLHVPAKHAEAEVRRTYAEPAYQLAYAVGRRELLSLREAYRRRVGSGFALGPFHDAVLAYGAIPISLVRWGLGVDA
jgi:Bacterial protein of unknown function (DUF885)